jgi:protein involved in polysaccharide export with SLBB domain
MKYWISVCIIFTIVFSVQPVHSQNIGQQQLKTIDVDAMSDAQIAFYWEKAKSEGYTLDQLEVIATSKGMAPSQFSKLRQRISSLRYSDTSTNTTVPDSKNTATISNLERFGLEPVIVEKVGKNLLFGYDFFNNPNISFAPNLNLATPTTYQLGPGDELLIDVWGAAENNYRKQVDREGAIRIENIGPVYVSGLSIEKAKTKIISYLKKIYSGIGASSSSHNKVFAEVSLVGVRTVQVNIIGEVKVPGTYSLSALSSVLNALYAAGGPTEKGTFREVKVVRNGKRFVSFDIYKYLMDGDENGNVLLRDQDVILVRPYISKVSVSGNVKRPGVFELKEGETIQELESYFSGFNANAYKNRLFVERVNGTQKEVNEIDANNQNDFILKDGDKVRVGAIIDRFENRVTIEGAVYRPGSYELTQNLKLSELIEKAEGLRDNVFLDRGLIYRTIDDVNQEIVSFSVKEILEEASDIFLKREDKVEIFSKDDLKEVYTVSIDGAVNKPQKIKFVEKMQLEDIIAISGGLKEGADVNIIDISRLINDDKFETISKTFRKSSSGNLVSQEGGAFYLEPFDRISIRYLKGYTKQQNVRVKGEVSYPGAYSITAKNERISDLIDKAGGFSPYAFLKGAVLLRKSSKVMENEQKLALQNLAEQDSLITELPLANEMSIGVDMEKIFARDGKYSKYDLILEEGDVLVIPAEKQTVEVRGEVMAPKVIRYDSKKSLKDYIDRSGGFSQRAKKGKAYVVYANGDVKSTKRFLFFKTYPKIESGALIVVPQKIERKERSLQEMIGLSTALGTLGLLIQSFL